MDPDSNLAEQIRIAEGLVDEDEDSMSASDMASSLHAAQRLAELVLALDGWVRSGGFLPKAWGVRE